MPHALFVSPHLDDVAFSCGGALARLLAEGWSATVATVFTASVAEPSPFAVECRLDKGLPADVDYTALRRAEDHAFAKALGGARPGTLALRHGPFAEAPHRGYASAADLFAGVHEGDRNAWRDVRAWLAEQVEEAPPALLFAPQALGRHADHLHVARAARALVEAWPGDAGTANAGAAPPVAWYRDVPYALREPGAAPCRWALGNASHAGGSHDSSHAGGRHASERAIPLGAAALEAKLRGAAAYESQIGFQFGSEAALREALAAFAREEAQRFGGAGNGDAVGNAVEDAVVEAVRLEARTALPDVASTLFVQASVAG